MKNLPLSIQTFKKIIEANNVYVDKTQDIYNLISSNDSNFFFLSRPRRFGKSLLVTTLKELFLGNKELFKNLWIYDKIEFKKYPVIHIDFLGMNYSKGSELFELTFFEKIKDIGQDYNINLESIDYKSAFKELIEKLSKIDKVVILIDEYDKPITEHVDNIPLAIENRKILKGFYEIMKESDQYIKFAFLTGVSKFAKVSVFSGLNNLRDITLDDKFSTITGYTEKELYSYFDEHIEATANKLKISNQELKQGLKTWYNGYSWNGVNFVYNPFSILNIFTSQQIKNYWFQSGTPTFLITLIKNYNIDIKKLENLVLNNQDFDSYDIDDMNIYALLFQTGYLTIKEIKSVHFGYEKYTLGYPNLEVRQSFLNSLLNSFAVNNPSNFVSAFDMVNSLEENNLEQFFKILTTIFGSIPHQISPDENTTLVEKESYYHTIFYLIFRLIGVNIRAELSTSKGRVDAVIENNHSVYIFEFKIGRSPKRAIEQIEDKYYYESYLSSKKKIYMIGVRFSIANRNIKNYLVNQYI